MLVEPVTASRLDLRLMRFFGRYPYEVTPVLSFSSQEGIEGKPPPGRRAHREREG